MKPTCVEMLLFVSLAATMASRFAEPLSAEEARPADAFVDFIGLNTHLGYQDTTYRD